jgi:hypothetical protein
MTEDEEFAKLAGWDGPADLYREIWRNATPAQRLRKLQEMIELSRQAAKSRQATK